MNESPLSKNLAAGWKSSELGNLCIKIGTGATPRGGQNVYLPTRIEYALIRSQNVFDNFFDENGLVFITKEAAFKLKNSRVVSGDLLLNITGDGITFSRCCKVPQKILPACVNQHVAIIRPDEKLCHPGFLLAVFTHPRMKDYIESFNAGGSRRAITKGHIKSFIVPVPPLAEQKAIAHVLGSLDDKIELNRRMNETLEGMARALFQSWFVDFDPVIDNALSAGNPIPEELAERAERRRQALADGTANREIARQFPNAFHFTEELGWIPEGWSVGRVNDLCGKIQNGGTPKKDVKEFWINGTVPWLTSGEVRQSIITSTKGSITELGLEKSSAKWLPAGSTVVAMYGATAGQVAFVNCALTTNQAVCALIPKEHFKNFNYLLISGKVRHLESLARGSAQQNISKAIIATSNAVIPSLSLIKSFDKQTQAFFAKWAKNLHANEQLYNLRDTLLPKLISGEIRLPDAEKLIEEALDSSSPC